MATHFSANQYENAFRSNKLANWEVASSYKERPRSKNGVTPIIANDRGHITPEQLKSSKNPWGNYVGTWDFPRRVPGNSARVGTARSQQSQQRLQQEIEEASRVLKGGVKNVNRTTYRNMGGEKPPAAAGNANKPQGVDPVMDSSSPVFVTENGQRSPSPPVKPEKTVSPTCDPN